MFIWCIDKLLRYLLRSTYFTCMNFKTDFYYTCKWQDVIQAWWGCLVLSSNTIMSCPHAEYELFVSMAVWLTVLDFFQSRPEFSISWLPEQEWWLNGHSEIEENLLLHIFLATLMFGFLIWLFMIQVLTQLLMKIELPSVQLY